MANVQFMPPIKHILWLSLAENVNDAPFCDLINLARQTGISISPVETPPPIDSAQFSGSLVRADGYLLTFQDIIHHDPFREQIIAEVKKGKKLLVSCTGLDFNELLVEFDLAITKDLLCGPSDLFGDERTLLVRHQDQTNSTAQALLNGTDLTVSSPSRVWYGSTAHPLFSAPVNSRVLNESDYFEDPGPRDLCCGGLWVRQSDGPAGVLVLAGAALCDPCTGITGKFFPGIRANVRFTERLLDWLIGEVVVEPAAGAAVEMLHKIECSLHDLLMHGLKQHFQNGPKDWWYRGIPESLRKKAAELSEESMGHIRKEQGFYFISYKTIIEHNWGFFEPHFDPKKQGKKKALNWILEVNEIRNRLSHPLRLREHPLTSAEHSTIEKWKRLVDALYRKLSAKPAGRNTSSA